MTPGGGRRPRPDVVALERASRPPADPAGRVPPHDLDAEAALLGAMLLSRPAIAAALLACAADDFYRPAHASVFAAVASLYDEGQPVDPVTVADRLRGWGRLDDVGGGAALLALQADTPSTSSAARYGEIVARHARARRLLAAAAEATERAYGHDLAGAEAALAEARVAGASAPAGRPLARIDLGPAVADGVAEPRFVAPWLYAGGLVTLSSEPGVGKSWLALWLALGVLRAGWSVAYLDEEGGPELVAERLRLLGAAPAVVGERLFYFAFEGRRWDDEDVGALGAVVDEASGAGRGLGLAVLDSLPDFLAAAGLDEDSAGDVTAFVARVCGPLRAAGAASLLLDHLPKPSSSGADARRSRSRYGRGSGAKLAKADAALLVEAAAEFDAATSGQLRVWATKDRRGRLGLPRLGRAPLLLDVRVGPGEVRILPAASATAATPEAEAWDGPTRCMDAVAALLADVAPAEKSQRQLVEALRATGHAFRDATVREAAERLALAGRCVVRTGPRGARLYRHRRREEEG